MPPGRAFSWNTSTWSSLIALTPGFASNGWRPVFLTTTRAGRSDPTNFRVEVRIAGRGLCHAKCGQANSAQGKAPVMFCNDKAVRHRHLLRTARPPRFHEASGPERSFQSTRPKVQSDWKNLKGQTTMNLRIYKGKSRANYFHPAPFTAPQTVRDQVGYRALATGDPLDRANEFDRCQTRAHLTVGRRKRKSSRWAPDPQGLSRHSRRLPAARAPARYSTLPCRLRLSQRRLSRKATDG